MRKEYASLRRRPFLAPVWILTFLAAVSLLVAGWAVHVATTTVVIVIRHAEKASDGTADPALTSDGLGRAARLAGLLGSGTAGTGIDAIFVTQFRRSRETAQPLAVQRAIPVVTLPADDVAGLEQRIESEFSGRRVLVVAHTDTIPEIVRRLGQSAAPAPIAEDEFGTAYLIAIPRWGKPSVLRLSLP